MGGVKFFNVTLDSANGDLGLVSVALQGMNAPVDDAAEERKGGAGHLAKALLSAGDTTVAFVCHVPKELAEAFPHVKAADWVEKLIAAAGGKVAQREDSEEVIKVLIEGDSEKGLFPLKMRDAASSAGFAYLREQGLLPADDSDDDYIPDPEAAGIEW